MQTFDSIVTCASVRMPTSSPIQTWSPIVSRHGNETFTFARITTPRPIFAPNAQSSAQRRDDRHRSRTHQQQLLARSILYRELFYFLVRHDVLVRYKQPMIGI